MYGIYIEDSSNNKFYHNNIYGGSYPYYMNANNVWDNGYPSGGNYWEGYPYADVKSGENQNLPGGDGIGDTPVGEEIFNQGGNNVDNYPLMTKREIGAPNVNSSTSPSANPSLTISTSPTGTTNPTIEPSTSSNLNLSPSPTIPEFPSALLVVLIVAAPTIAGAMLHRRKQSKI